jgi:natural product precursor
MKKLKSLINLTNLNSENLNEKELSHLIGGECCHCGCFYCSCGGASNSDNYGANSSGCKVSPLPADDVSCGICT